MLSRRMSGTDLMTHSKVILHPDPSRTVVRPFEPGDPELFANKECPRLQRIAQRILSLDEEGLCAELGRIRDSFSGRREDVERILRRRFDDTIGDLGVDGNGLSELRKLVIGGYFCEEFSFEAAALFNPSIVCSEPSATVPYPRSSR